MSPLEIVKVESKAQQKQFLKLPWAIYANDPHWIPPLQQNQKELVGFAKHPFYDFAQRQAFLALRGGKPVGRILAIVNPTHNDRYDERRGFFGFFESENEQETASALLDAAWQWCQAQGMDTFRGPVNPSLNYECGLLIDGFDSSPTFMMTYNPSYYPALMDTWGLTKSQDLFAFWGHVDMLAGLDKKLEFVVHEATRRFDLHLRPMSRKNFDEDVRMFLHIYNESLGGTWGFTPLSAGEVDHMSKSLKHLIVPEMTSVAEVDGKPVGSVFGLLDYNPRIKLIDGKLFPFGFMRLLFNRKKITRVRMIATNVLPEYQRWGVGLVLMSRLVPEVLKTSVEEAEFSWVLESNNLSRKTLERGGAKLTKTYRIYDFEPGGESGQ